MNSTVAWEELGGQEGSAVAAARAASAAMEVCPTPTQIFSLCLTARSRRVQVAMAVEVAMAVVGEAARGGSAMTSSSTTAMP